MNHIYGVNKYTYAWYCTETYIFFKTTKAGSGFGGELSGSRKKGPDPTGFGSATLAKSIIKWKPGSSIAGEAHGKNDSQ